MSTPSFPRQQARTRRFTLGVPRAFTSGVGPDGPLVLFLRTDDGEDPVTHLWRLDARGRTTKLVDARALGDDGELPPEERARRERAREQAGGIVSYAVDRDLRVAAFALAGRLHTVEVATGRTVAHVTAGPAFDPRPSPDGRRVAYHATDGLHVIDLDDGPVAPGTTRPLVVEDGVSWGRAEFVAAEEMGRSRGFWWSGDSTRLAVARVDETDVPVWHIADPANPASAAVEHRYPAAGTTNADVSLWCLEVEAPSTPTEVVWDRTQDEYLASVRWGTDPLTLLVQPRDQRTARVLTADPGTGTTTLVRAWHDDAWVELVPGVPAWHGARLLTIEDRAERGVGGTRTLCIDGVPWSPPGLQVRELLGVEPASDEPGTRGVAILLASDADDPTRTDVYRLVLDPEDDACWSPTGDDPGRPPALRREVHGRGAGAPIVAIEQGLDAPAPRITVSIGRREVDLEVAAATPVVTARPRMLTLGERGLRAALLLPSDDDGTSPLPVLLDPYGGPHAQRVLSAQSAFLAPQWLADQGFAVLVVDGRGSPGRGPAFERAVHHDLATPVLEDQIAALHAAAALEPRLDLDRVALRGWSFGGYLAALAVLRRPDVFRAGIAGAPVTDWRLYDTHYTERYLGHPDEHPDAYATSSLVDAVGRLLGAARWDAQDPPRLLLIHGLADDNVVAAHALRLSSALLADGRRHTFLPLSGVTHMTPQEVVAEQLLVQQVAFLREAFGHR
ncbi:MAG: prolyl oligopeptidase family serine peptidase [Nitriliruptoraceae bacterium]|nr:prolyl oligopeptidase family serine peptidase [Nitriliruptoraceae bacterium]